MQQVISGDISGHGSNSPNTVTTDLRQGQFTPLVPELVDGLESVLAAETSVDDPVYLLTLHQELAHVAQVLLHEDERSNRRFLGEFPRYDGTARKLLQDRNQIGLILCALGQRVLETGRPLTAREQIQTRRILRKLKSNLVTERELYWRGYWVDLGAGD